MSKVSKRMRFEVLKRDKFQCQYCGESAPKVILHVDHIVPKSAGGKNTLLNLITACIDCNLGKSDKHLSDSSAISKQKKQMDEIQERKNQLVLMAEWQKQIEIEKNSLAQLVVSKINKYLAIYKTKCSESFEKEIEIATSKYSINDLMDAVDKSYTQYFTDEKSIDIFLEKIIKIAYWTKKEKEDPDLAFRVKAAGLATKRWYSCYRPTFFSVLKNLMDNGVSQEEIMDAIYSSSGITKFEEHFE